jgi:hypothetical protein
MLFFKKSSVTEDIDDDGDDDDGNEEDYSGSGGTIPSDALNVINTDTIDTGTINTGTIRPINPYYPSSTEAKKGEMDPALLGLSPGEFPIFSRLSALLSGNSQNVVPSSEEYKKLEEIQTRGLRTTPEAERTNFHSILGSFGVHTEYPGIKGTPAGRYSDRQGKIKRSNPLGIHPLEHFHPNELNPYTGFDITPKIPEGYTLSADHYRPPAVGSIQDGDEMNEENYPEDDD